MGDLERSRILARTLAGRDYRVRRRLMVLSRMSHRRYLEGSLTLISE
jgi:hypothetical protein